MPAKTSQEISDSIINAAQYIFSRYGFKKSTMEEIAAAAHKAKSSIYYYFKNKEDIFQAIVEKEYALFQKEIEGAVNKENSPQRKLRAYIFKRNEIIDKFLNFFRAIKDEYLEQYSFIENIRKKYYDEEIQIIRNILGEGIRQSAFMINDLELTVFAIIIALKGLEYPWFIENHASKQEENIDKLLEILFYGIVKS